MLEVINNIINKMFLSVSSDGLLLLEKIGTISDDIFNIEPLKFFLSEDVKEVIHALSLLLIAFFLIVFILETIFSKKDDIFLYFRTGVKVIIVSIICLNSYNVCKEIVHINYNITSNFKELLENISDEKIEYQSLKDNVETLEDYLKEQDKLSVNGIIDVVFLVLVCMLIVAFSIRYVIIVVCIILSPIFVIFSLNKKTSVFFKLFLKFLLIGLIVQNLNLLLLFICISAKNEKELYACILIGSCMLLYKANKKVGEQYAKD